MQDPKITLINLLTLNLPTVTYPASNPLAGDNIVTKDDGVTPANVKVTSSWYTDQLMSSFDALVTVSTVSDPIVPSGFGFVSGEDHTYMADLNVWCITKNDPTSGAVVITDEVMRSKLIQALDLIVAQNRINVSGIHRLKASKWQDMDEPGSGDPTSVLRRSLLEVECYIPTVTSLAQ